MKKILLTIIAFGLLAAGCNGVMTNDEIIKETKKCKDAGMDVQVNKAGSGAIYDVQCDVK